MKNKPTSYGIHVPRKQGPYERGDNPITSQDLLRLMVEFASEVSEARRMGLSVKAMDRVQMTLDWMLDDFRRWEAGKKRGREPEVGVWLRAAIAAKLIDGGHTTSIKNALWAAYPNATVSEHDSIKKAYTKLKNGKCPINVSVSDRTLTDAINRLKPSRNGNK